MTNARKTELYYNMLDHISELVSGNDLVDTLRAIGFTDKEIAEEGFMEETINYNDLLMEQQEQM